MRFAILSLVSFISIVSAAIQDNVPACALKCINDNPNAKCPQTNPSWFVCNCGDPKWLKIVVDCAAKACQQSDLDIAVAEGVQGCDAAGYKLAAPSVVAAAIGADLGDKTLPTTVAGVTFASTYPNSAAASGGANPVVTTPSATPNTASSSSSTGSGVSSSNTTASGSGNPKSGAEKAALGSLVVGIILGTMMV
ncbi:putative GPI-anchored protein 7 [Neolecta irregularis DAH-3]|uniref:Putative GPI-anchored protein 7 n=1 Tax=Neolecta irregularis (strain DAH-3) TaxID=1198029 RepID=A0A1U7LRD1_NEOID|nr:putative GPI-anchored protein 7 [Neolecta irregularis DAH-3]|eukprot:OLL25204.1 putative GPI-anchored protein 7 [Neolecta irregularis DAH-3]